MKPEQEQQIWEFIGEVRTDIKSINNMLSGLPCKSHGEEIQRQKDFRTNMTAKIGIGTTIAIFIGGFLMWLTQEIIKKFWLR